MLKMVVETVPEGLEEHYEAGEDGKFNLKVEDAVSQDQHDSELSQYKSKVDEYKGKVDEFRNNNIELSKQVESLATNKDGAKDVNLEQLVDARVADLKSAMDDLQTQYNTLTKNHEEVVLSDKVKELAIKHGVHDSALPDVISRAQSVFEVKEGSAVPRDGTRDAEGNVMSPEAWIGKLTNTAPHLFRASNGAGAKRPVGGKSTQDMSSEDKIAAGLADRR